MLYKSRDDANLVRFFHISNKNAEFILSYLLYALMPKTHGK